jgi:hypothetical protein
MAEKREGDSTIASISDDDAGGCALEPGAVACDACGAAMKPMGHCKYWCLRCGFLRTCNDTI